MSNPPKGFRADMCGASCELHATARLTMNKPMHHFEHDIVRGYHLTTNTRTDEVSHSRLRYFFGAGLIGLPFSARSPTDAISTITGQRNFDNSSLVETTRAIERCRNSAHVGE